MKAINVKWLGLLALAALPLYSGYSQSPPAPAAPPATPPPSVPAPATPPVLTIPKPNEEKAEVLKLTKAGMSEDVVLAYVKNARTSFNLSAGDILHLKDEGVSAPVLAAMLTHDSALRHDALNQPASQFAYNQQSYPGSQPPPGQTIAQPPPEPAPADTAQIATPPLVPTGAPDGAVPPPTQVEVVPVAPGADYYWAPGYWGWNGGWIWIGGGWYPHGYYGWGWRGGWGGWGRGGWGRGGGGGWGRGGGGGGHGGGGGRGH